MQKRKKIPDGVRLISHATGVRWLGYGLVESFIPAFLIIYAQSYSEAGLFSSIYQIFFILSLPFIGFIADKVRAKDVLLAGSLIYPFVALGYIFTGITGAIIFLLLAKWPNGT